MLTTTITRDVAVDSLRPGHLLLDDTGALLRVDTIEHSGTGAVAWCRPPDRPTIRRTRVPLGDRVRVAPFAHDEQTLLAELADVIGEGRKAMIGDSDVAADPGYRVEQTDGGIAVTTPGGWVLTIADPRREDEGGDDE